MMEIGSDFDLDFNKLHVTKNNIFNYLKEYNSLYFDSGRSAIKAIRIPKGKVLLPKYTCESVINCFNKKDIVFYELDDNFNINISDLVDKLDEAKTLFIMHYFGCVQNKKILKKIKEICIAKSITIIEDTTHSLLSCKSTIGDYFVCSLRKWFPIARGGVLYSKNKIVLKEKYTKDNDNYRLNAMILKNMFLNNIIESKDLYLSIFNKCENDLNKKSKVLLMSDLSMYILSCFDIKDIKQRRISNYNYLLKNLKIKPVNRIKNNECAFVYLIRLDKRNDLRKYLIKNNIFCAIHWPNCSNNELSLTIDHRYTSKNMKYIVDKINSFIDNR